MNILALDASTKNTGYAIFNDGILAEYDCISASSNDLIKRINKIIIGIDNVLSNNEINELILEEVRQEDGIKNIKTYKALMYLQAAIVFLIHERYSKVKITFIYPSSWRSLCGIKTGRGIKRDSLKQKDIEFVKDKYSITVNDDIADAIGIGYAHLHPAPAAPDYDWS